jgi:uncharacterized protein (DUF305 family)
MRIRLTALAALAAGATLLSACGSNSTDTSSQSSTTTSSHNPADVSFATQMIPHHEQAVVMADLAAAQASNADVKVLAKDIKTAQNPEIATMSGWLKSWGQPVPMPSMTAMPGTSSMNGMENSATGTGMMTDADMAMLSNSSGAAFDRQWVTMMIAHHQGAVTMARAELAKGQASDATALARSIISSQTAQIQQLEVLQQQLG